MPVDDFSFTFSGINVFTTYHDKGVPRGQEHLNLSYALQPIH